MTRQVNSGVDLSIRQFCEAWRLMCRGCPGRSLESGNGIEYIFSNLPIGFSTSPSSPGNPSRETR